MSDDAPQLYRLDLHDAIEPGAIALTIMFTAAPSKAYMVACGLYATMIDARNPEDPAQRWHDLDGYTLEQIESYVIHRAGGHSPRRYP